jgi:peptidoglycan recognition protein
VRIIPRAEWGAQHGTGHPMEPSAEIVVHHTVGAPRSSDPTVEALWVLETEADHRSRDGWKGIGYSWLIMPSGRVYEGRGWRRSGAHTPGRNSSAHGVAFVGDFREAEPTPEAVAAFRELVAEGRRAGHVLTSTRITGHRDYRATECPGETLYRMLPRLLIQPVEPPGTGWGHLLRRIVRLAKLAPR